MSYQQLPLKFSFDEPALRKHLEASAGKPIALTLTNNARAMISVREKPGLLSIRLHRIFLCADRAVLAEVAAFIKGHKGPKPCIRQFINTHRDSLPEAKPKKTRLDTKGRFHDLREIFDAVNHCYFSNRLSSEITWGRQSLRNCVKKRTLGSFQPAANLIKISPILDRTKVPRYFIEYVVYHEMLHADLGVGVENGRRKVHSATFKQREKLYRCYDKAIAWEKHSFGK